MKTMGDRLASALEARGKTAADLIAKFGWSKGRVYNILDDTTKPDKVWASTIEAICSYLSIRWEWLLHGRGAMDASAILSHSAGLDLRILRQAIRMIDDRVAKRSLPGRRLRLTDAEIDEWTEAVYRLLANGSAREDAQRTVDAFLSAVARRGELVV